MIADLKPYPEYKESALPWLGRVPGHWDTRRLRHACEMRVSNVDKHTKKGETPIRLCNYVEVYKNERIRESTRFMSATASEDERIRLCLHKGDVLITKDSEEWNDIGVPSLVEYEAPDLVCGYHLAILRARPLLHGPFLHRALECHFIAAQFHVEANGVTRYGLSHGAIQGVSIPLPPPAEQAAIVRFMDWANGRLERAIRAKRKVIALLTEQKQAIIHRAFTRGLDPSVPFKPSGIPWLGDIPQHWDISRSKRLFSARKDLALPNDVQLSATQAYGVIPQSDFEEKVGRRVVKISMHLEKRRHVERDDFVISMRSFQGGIERAWVSGAIRSSYVVLKPERGVDVVFFAYLFKSRGYIGALQRTADFIRDGQDLNFGNFCRVDLPLIPLEEQRAIAQFIAGATEGMDTTTSRLEREIELLREYRTRLVADVVTGKLDVREAAARLPEEAATDTVEEAADGLDETELAADEAAA